MNPVPAIPNGQKLRKGLLPKESSVSYWQYVNIEITIPKIFPVTTHHGAFQQLLLFIPHSKTSGRSPPELFRKYAENLPENTHAEV